MLIAYWIIAGLLALFYLYSGGMKVIRSRAQLQPMMGWVENAPMAGVRVIGVLEVLAAIGLVLPPLTGIAPWLALVAAAGLVLVQIAAAILHLSRGEGKQVPMNVVLLVLAAVTVWLSTIWL
jgi:hypothetical protein